MHFLCQKVCVPAKAAKLTWYIQQNKCLNVKKARKSYTKSVLRVLKERLNG